MCSSLRADIPGPILSVRLRERERYIMNGLKMDSLSPGAVPF